MKFVVKHVGQSGRLGCLSGVDKRLGEIFETPLLTMYTRGGSVPHITHEVLQMITKENLLLQMPLTTLMSAYSSIESFGKGLSEFVGLKEYPCYVTPQDPATETPTGYNVSNKVAVWTRNGKRTVDPVKYMNMIEEMRPDMYLALCDGDTDSGSSKKRITKSVQRTLTLFRECYRHHQESKVLINAALLAPIEGGYDLHARRVFSEEMAQYDVAGYVLDGLHTNGAEAEKIKFDTIEPVIKECLKCLPKEKLRVAHGAWNPCTLIKLVAAGFDMFDTSLPYLSTERGKALVFPYDQNMITPNTGPNSVKNTDHYEISLEDSIYAEDFKPVLQNCACLTCKQHTRAYIHHLLKSQELLGRVLIMIHNLHHYLEFFKSIRRAILNDSLDSLCFLVQTQDHDS